jgi:cytochrome P450
VCSKDQTIDGRFVPAGRFVAVSPFVVHRDPSVYRDPESFDITRWGRGEGTAANTFIPFGRGVHKCPGMRLAETESRMAALLLQQRFVVTLTGASAAAAMHPNSLNWFSPGFPQVRHGNAQATCSRRSR